MATPHYWERSRQRLDCLLHGHRDLARAAAYGEILPGLAVKELHYCGSCGGPVWVDSPLPQSPPNWAATGLPTT